MTKSAKSYRVDIEIVEFDGPKESGVYRVISQQSLSFDDDKQLAERAAKDALVAGSPSLQLLLPQNRYLTLDEISQLAGHFSGSPLGEYLSRKIFAPANGQCFEVPLAWRDAAKVDQACEILNIGEA